MKVSLFLFSILLFLSCAEHAKQHHGIKVKEKKHHFVQMVIQKKDSTFSLVKQRLLPGKLPSKKKSKRHIKKPGYYFNVLNNRNVILYTMHIGEIDKVYAEFEEKGQMQRKDYQLDSTEFVIKFPYHGEYRSLEILNTTSKDSSRIYYQTDLEGI